MILKSFTAYQVSVQIHILIYEGAGFSSWNGKEDKSNHSWSNAYIGSHLFNLLVLALTYNRSNYFPHFVTISTLYYT